MSELLIIQKSDDEPLYLDGFDGREYEWTTDKKSAWTFKPLAGETKLFKLRELFPDAKLIKR
ncbi:hypothetical protein [Caudoviricetes sp.]|nr:hypothetical protein [Caudoviricetes sp.]